MAVVAPALLFPTPLRLLAVLALVPVWFAGRRLYGHALEPTPLNVPIALLVIAATVSTIWTYDPTNAVGKIGGLLLGLVAYYAIVRALRTDADLLAGLEILALAGLVLALAVLFGARWLGKVPGLAKLIIMLPRLIRGVPGAESGFHPNPAAGTIALFLPLQAWLAFRTPRGGLHRAFHISAFIATTAVFALTQSRGAWAGLALSCGLVWACTGGRSRRIATLAMLLVAALATLGPGRINMFIFSGLGSDPDLIGRLVLWQRAIVAIHEFPFTGLGFNAFRRVVHVLYPFPHLDPSVDVAHAHNQVLQVGVDLGVLGLVAYLVLWMDLFGSLVAVITRLPRRVPHRQIAVALVVGLLAHFLFGITDAVPLGAKPGVAFWLIAALAAATSRLAATSAPPSGGTPSERVRKRDE